LNRFFSFLFDIYRFREILWDLTKRDIKNRYLGSYLGFFWAFIQPLINLALLWFVFTYGLKARPESDVPFVLWLMAGLIPWNFISESILGSTSSILENSFLVKKVVFRVSLLPIVKVISSSVIHLFFIFILLLAFLFNGIPFTVYTVQILYYFLLTVLFVLGSFLDDFFNNNFFSGLRANHCYRYSICILVDSYILVIQSDSGKIFISTKSESFLSILPKVIEMHLSIMFGFGINLFLVSIFLALTAISISHRKYLYLEN
jgi:hypothetical protein